MPKNDDLLPQYQPDDIPPLPIENQQLPSETVERMYLVVRSLKQGEKKLDYKLRKHDIIKLGRVKFKVKEIRIKEIHDEKQRKKHKKEKYMKKLQEEESKKLEQAAAAQQPVGGNQIRVQNSNN